MTRSRQQTRTIFSSPVQTHQLTNISIPLSLTRNRQKLPQWHSRVISTNSKACFRNTKASPYTHIKNIPQWPTKAKNLKVNSHKVSNTHTLHKAKTKNLLPFSHTHSNGGHIEGKLFVKLTQREKKKVFDKNMGFRRMIGGNLDPERKRSGGLRTKQAGRGSCRGS